MSLVLVTGAFGNVGRSALAALREMGVRTRALEYPSRRNESLAGRLARGCEIVWGDVRDDETVERAVRGADAVLHLAAVIPPAANADPELARSVNVGGTAAVLRAMRASPSRPRLVFASSVAAYGDRLADYYIRADDPLRPCADDPYASHKVECEALVRASGLEWTIFRLSYIVWSGKITMDPLMFRMPLDTRLEVCHTDDAGLALARAAFAPEAVGATWNLGGGESCRTTYDAYLDAMTRMFGLGGVGFMPEEAFSKAGYHCGYMDTDEPERVLGFQRRSLAYYYAEVERKARPLRFWARAFAAPIRSSVLAGSSYLRAYLAERGRRAPLHYRAPLRYGASALTRA